MKAMATNELTLPLGTGVRKDVLRYDGAVPGAMRQVTIGGPKFLRVLQKIAVGRGRRAGGAGLAPPVGAKLRGW